MKKNSGLMALQFGLMLGSLGGHRILDWDEDVTAEKSGLPKKEPMPLTDEEKEKLSTLSSKNKKKYINELRRKYEEGV